MCCCSVWIIIMKHAPSLFLHTLCPFVSFPTSLFFFCPHLFVSAFIHSYVILCHLLQPAPYFPLPYPCITLLFSLSSHPFSSLQRCRCHQSFVCPRSESCRFKSGSSTHRVLSWLPSTLLFTPAGPAKHTSSASSTGPCWSERHRGKPIKHAYAYEQLYPALGKKL